MGHHTQDTERSSGVLSNGRKIESLTVYPCAELTKLENDLTAKINGISYDEELNALTSRLDDMSDEMTEKYSEITQASDKIQTIVDEINRIDGVVTEQRSSIEQTASSITSRVNAIVGGMTQQKSEIRQTAEEISLRVSDLESGTSAQLQVLSDEISSKVTSAEAQSLIDQKADEITLSVASTYATKDSTITGQTIHYLATSEGSGVTTSTSGWTDTPQTMDATNKYLWTYLTYTYGDGSTADTNPVITGTYGQDGANGTSGTDGVSVTSVIPLYYCTSSNTSTPSISSSTTIYTTDVRGYWTTKIPTMTSTYKYLYTCNKVTYSNGSVSFSDVTIDQTLTDLVEFKSSASLVIDDSSIQSIVTNGNLISAINQTAGSVLIEADKIDLHGNVHVSDIVGDTTNYITVNEDIAGSDVSANYYGGSTISGGYIIKPTASTATMLLSDFRPIDWESGDEFYYDFTARSSSSGTFYIRLALSTSLTATSSTVTYSSLKSLNAYTSDTSYTGTLTMPSMGSSYKYFAFMIYRTSYQMYLCDASIRKKSGGNLIVDGSITTDKMNLYGMLTIYDSSSHNASATIGYGQGYDGTSTTYGAMMKGTGNAYIIVTNQGARMTYGSSTSSNSIYVTSSGSTVQGDLTVTGDIEHTPTVYSNYTSTTSGSSVSAGTWTRVVYYSSAVPAGTYLVIGSGTIEAGTAGTAFTIRIVMGSTLSSTSSTSATEPTTYMRGTGYAPNTSNWFSTSCSDVVTIASNTYFAIQMYSTNAATCYGAAIKIVKLI